MWDFLGERYGFAPWDIARLHPSEIKKYTRGAESREEKKQRQTSANRTTPVSENQRKREQEALEKYK